MLRKHTAYAAICAAACLSACTHSSGSGGSSSSSTAPPSTQDGQVVVSAGAAELKRDTNLADSTTAADKTRLQFSKVDSSFSVTTPAQTPVSFSVSAVNPSVHGHVTLRAALAGGSSTAITDFASAGLTATASNVVDGGAWLETHGDGFARLSFTGQVAQGTNLILERVDSAGNKSHSVVNLGLGPTSFVNPNAAPVTSANVTKTTPVYSSSSWLFGLPAICGNGDRVSVVFYDSDPNATGSNGPIATPCCVPGYSRIQKRLQLDTTNQKVTVGGSEALGNDGCYWRDTEMAGLFNVIAIAQAGADGIRVDLSFDRGGTFASSINVGTGRTTRLARIVMAPNYQTAVIYWDEDTQGTEDRLMLVEGAPSTYDQNGSPTAFAFTNPQVLLDLKNNTSSNNWGGGVTPLVSDLGYTDAGDCFVAYGYSTNTFTPLYDAQGNQIHPSRMTITSEIGCLSRPATGTTFSKTVIETMTDTVPSDPSLVLAPAAAGTQVYVAYETSHGINLVLSPDAAKTFPTAVTFGTSQAVSPRMFLRPSATGAIQIDGFYLDYDATNANAQGLALYLFHTNADLSKTSLSEVVAPKPGPTATGGYPQTESVGWFGFDATVLGGKLFAVVHTTLGGYMPMGGPFGAPLMGGAVPMAATSGAALPPPLAPGMTGTAPAFDPSATNKLTVLEID